MVELIAKSPCDGVLPVKIGKITLEGIDLGGLTCIMPYDGQDKEVSAALKEAHGMALPAVNRATGKDGARAIWFGRGQVMLAGPTASPRLAASAALVDQSDAWTTVVLSGPGAEDVLARLIPMDLRAGSFARGHTARTHIQHMNGSVTRIGTDTFLLMVFRSMAATLVHDVTDAMQTIAARG